MEKEKNLEEMTAEELIRTVFPKGWKPKWKCGTPYLQTELRREAEAAGMSYQEYVKQEQERYHKGLVEMAEAAGMTLEEYLRYEQEKYLSQPIKKGKTKEKPEENQG